MDAKPDGIILVSGPEHDEVELARLILEVKGYRTVIIPYKDWQADLAEAFSGERVRGAVMTGGMREPSIHALIITLQRDYRVPVLVATYRCYTVISGDLKGVVYFCSKNESYLSNPDFLINKPLSREEFEEMVERLVSIAPDQVNMPYTFINSDR